MNKETKLRARPAAITLTPAAEARIAELMDRAPEGATGVKLSTPRRGCSGLAYSVDYVTDEQPFDEKIETPGGTFYVDDAGNSRVVEIQHPATYQGSFTLDGVTGEAPANPVTLRQRGASAADRVTVEPGSSFAPAAGDSWVT